MTYLNDEQVAQLLRGINPKRVGQNQKGYSHVEAYEIRAHLTRIFGFGRWSQRVLAMEPVFEHFFEDPSKGKEQDRVTVGYRAHVELAVCAPDGTHLATYSEWASGDAQNFPLKSRGDAHDFAMKTAESQGLKRAAINLGDNFGLSLYAKGSTAALIKRTLVTPATQPVAADDAVDAHITEQLPAENEQAEPQAEVRSTNNPDHPQTPPAPETPVPVPEAPNVKPEQAAEIAQRALAGPPPGEGSASKWLMHLSGEAMKQGLMKEQVENAAGVAMTLKALLDECLKNAARPRGNAAADKAAAS